MKSPEVKKLEKKLNKLTSERKMIDRILETYYEGCLKVNGVLD